jgi:hypothetical protein
VWAASDTFQIEQGRIRVRSNTPETAAAVRAVIGLDRLVDDDPDGAFAYSIRLEPPAAGRGASQSLHVLYEDCAVVRRTRDPLRLLRVLAAHVRGRDDVSAPGPLRMIGCAVVGVRGVALLPIALEPELTAIERRLNAAGLQLVDQPYLTFDPISAELLVPEPPEVDPSMLDGVELYRGREPGPAPAGRHRVSGWLLDELRGAEDRRAPALQLVLDAGAMTPDRTRRLIAKIQDSATLIARWYPWPDDLVSAVVRLAEGRR